MTTNDRDEEASEDTTRPRNGKRRDKQNLQRHEFEASYNMPQVD